MGFGLFENFTIEDAFDIEKNVLYELPEEDYDFVEYTEVSPQFNHVQVDKMYYSIPFDYRHDKLTAYISEQYVEIHRDGMVLCVHDRLTGRPGQYRTELEHLPNEKNIIDAKYYSHTTQVQFDKHTLHSNNLYQIFTYVKNRSYQFGEKENTVSGMLLYAKAEEEIQPDNVYQMHGSQISVKTLDLNLPFAEIASQMDRIVETHFSGLTKAC